MSDSDKTGQGKQGGDQTRQQPAEPKPIRDGFREDQKPNPNILYEGGKPGGGRPPKK